MRLIDKVAQPLRSLLTNDIKIRVAKGVNEMKDKCLNILLIEDSKLDADLIREMLNKVKNFSFNLETVARLSTGLASLDKGGIDLVLLDLLLPDSQGLNTFNRVFAQEPEVPIIILSILEDERLAMKAVENGAQDYLFKGQLDNDLLARSIGYALMRKQAEKELRIALQEKEILLREIHHRVKNNLQVISSLLYLQERYIEDERYKYIFKDTRNRIKSMALIHDRLCHSPNLSNINFAEYIKDTANTLLQSYKTPDKIILSIDVEDIVISIESAVPCGLILNELISNSLKHAFPEGKEGEIQLSFYRSAAGLITLMVSDNGVGFPNDFDFKDSKSLGMKLINLLVHQINGTLELDRTGGTSFKISFSEFWPRPTGAI